MTRDDIYRVDKNKVSIAYNRENKEVAFGINNYLYLNVNDLEDIKEACSEILKLINNEQFSKKTT